MGGGAGQASFYPNSPVTKYFSSLKMDSAASNCDTNKTVLVILFVIYCLLLL